MHKQVIEFWFDEIEPVMWFKKDDDFDRLLHSRFGEIWRAAAAGELAHWRDTIEGRLAEVIVLDQFSRNLFRGTPQSFACDGMALVLAQEAIRSGECERLSREQRGFLYLPFMHSESPLRCPPSSPRRSGRPFPRRRRGRGRSAIRPPPWPCGSSPAAIPASTPPS